VSLVARHLEANGIATAIVGSARDIVEIAGVPRFVFVDYPLGNPMGQPGKGGEQASVLEAALRLVETAGGPRTTQQLDLDWGSEDWRANFMHVGEDNAAELAELGRQRREKQSRKK